jgi:hypothetical protein
MKMLPSIVLAAYGITGTMLSAQTTETKVPPQPFGVIGAPGVPGLIRQSLSI